MHIHRSAPRRNFTVLPNSVVQDRGLSFTARGLLHDLLSRPDGWREDARQMADSSTQGRGAVRRALRELTEAGFYRVDKVRRPDGTVRSEAHAFDTPQAVAPATRRAAPAVRRAAPADHPPVPGGAESGAPDTPSVKDREKPPTLPAAPPWIREAVATLFRVIRPEPRLQLGESEARALAPLVAGWLDRGRTVAELAHALLTGLPAIVHSPVALLRSRLERKMPPAPPTAAASAPPPGDHVSRLPECTGCHDPVPRPGVCGACAGLGRPAVAVGGGAAATPAGAAEARAAMRGARATAGAA
ncbi:hypothetical protein [Kitasatospora sp. NPDC088346]|uniref:hypothetical protein n=1 Tax=Kitasatospora sp. NPDC088346 TaxID=3364073 RepID=UPI0038140156